jgi:hypothetical protein
MTADGREDTPVEKKPRHPSIGPYLWGFAVWAACQILFPQSAGGQTLTETQRAWLSRAGRHEKGGWIDLHVEGAPRERGFQHGFLMAGEIGQGIRATRVNWEYQSGMEWDWLVGKAASLFRAKIDAENLAEMNGIAEGLKAAGVSSTIDEILAYNGIIELQGYWWPTELRKMKDGPREPVKESCSAFIATKSMTSDGGIVLAHNTMTAYQSAPVNVIEDIQPEKGHRILMQTQAGWIHSGTDFFITDAGLVGAETTIGGFDGFDPGGIPEFIRMRRASQDAASIDEWCGIMKRGNNGGYANAWLLGDVNTGEIARLELGLKFIGFEKKADGFFIGSNVAENLKILRFETDGNETDIRKMSVSRRERWKMIMKQSAGSIDAELAKSFEADHFDTYLGEYRPGIRTLCAHGELERQPYDWPGSPYAPTGTVDAKVVDSKMAKRMTFAARWGSACGMPFDAGKFLADHPQFDWMTDILQSRPTEPWTDFTAGEK